MTIEAQVTLPAGWYSDPAQSGADRWWDGTGWTEHLRAPEAEQAFAPQPFPTMPPPSAPDATAFAPVATAVAPVAASAVAAPVVAAPISAPIAVQSAPITLPTLQAPAARPSASAPAAPATAAPAFVPLAPLSTGPVALAPVGAPPVVPMYESYDLHGDAVQMHHDPEVSNGAALLALLFGAASVGLAAIGQGILPYPQVWVSLACTVALIFGVRALVLYRRREASIRWAPTVGILLGLIATVTVFFGSTVLTVLGSVVPQAPPTLAPVSAQAPEHSSEPLVFPLNAGLTAQEKSTQTIATAINRTFAGGASTLPAGKAWPASLRMSGSTVIAPSGAHLANLPKGETASYALSSDGKSYQLTVTGSNSSEVANYNSQLNAFSFTCSTGDSTCTPSN